MPNASMSSAAAALSGAAPVAPTATGRATPDQPSNAKFGGLMADFGSSDGGAENNGSDNGQTPADMPAQSTPSALTESSKDLGPEAAAKPDANASEQSEQDPNAQVDSLPSAYAPQSTSAELPAGAPSTGGLEASLAATGRELSAMTDGDARPARPTPDLAAGGHPIDAASTAKTSGASATTPARATPLSIEAATPPTARAPEAASDDARKLAPVTADRAAAPARNDAAEHVRGQPSKPPSEVQPGDVEPSARDKITSATPRAAAEIPLAQGARPQLEADRPPLAERIAQPLRGPAPSLDAARPASSPNEHAGPAVPKVTVDQAAEELAPQSNASRQTSRAAVAEPARSIDQFRPAVQADERPEPDFRASAPPVESGDAQLLPKTPRDTPDLSADAALDDAPEPGRRDSVRDMATPVAADVGGRSDVASATGQTRVDSRPIAQADPRAQGRIDERPDRAPRRASAPTNAASANAAPATAAPAASASPQTAAANASQAQVSDPSPTTNEANDLSNTATDVDMAAARRARAATAESAMRADSPTSDSAAFSDFLADAELEEVRSAQPGRLAAHRFQTTLAHQAPSAQVAFSIAQNLADAPERIRIQMFPRELGEVEVVMEIREEGRTEVVVRAERPETMELLQKDARELQRALQAAGLDVGSDDLAFELGGRGADGEGRDGERQRADGSDDDPDATANDRFQPAPRWREMTPGGVDLVA